MGKSAQFPLHVWLPDSMEGPTPISALIHAATMVTAGIFMVARMSPLFELSQAALSFVIVIGAITAFFMALVAIVQVDIKRVVAYSTLSQLGYMTMALGAAAYPVAIFHLMTHAFFKAVLFLGAGSVIIALHHEQDMRKMGGLRKYMPSHLRDGAHRGARQRGPAAVRGLLLEGVHHRGAAPVADAGRRVRLRCSPSAGVFVGGFYSFRLVFFAFHGKERFRDAHGHAPWRRRGAGPRGVPRNARTSRPWVVTLPLVLLAIPSVVDRLVGHPAHALRRLVRRSPSRPRATMAEMAKHFHGAGAMVAARLRHAAVLAGARRRGRWPRTSTSFARTSPP